MNDSPARIDPEEAEIGRPTPTARRLVEASVSPNTRRAYAGALRQPEHPAGLRWRAATARRLARRPRAPRRDPGRLTSPELHDAGRASSTASMAVAAACFRAKLAGQPTPAGEGTALGARRVPADRLRSEFLSTHLVFQKVNAEDDTQRDFIAW